MIRSVAAALALLWTAPVVTEKVEVSDRGAIDLAPFACTDTPRSSIVQRVCYDEARRYLLVHVSGSYRAYCELPAATFNAFVSARSMGQFYKQSIEESDRAAPFDCRADRALAN
jgi:KTSC domain-containing protein